MTGELTIRKRGGGLPNNVHKMAAGHDVAADVAECFTLKINIIKNLKQITSMLFKMVVNFN